MQDTHRAELFRRAVARHVQYAGWAADGQGVDRHLFGLKRMLREGEPVPKIYSDEAYAKTSHWELSTSQLSSPFVDGWGYGEGEPSLSPSLPPLPEEDLLQRALPLPLPSVIGENAPFHDVSRTHCVLCSRP